MTEAICYDPEELSEGSNSENYDFSNDPMVEKVSCQPLVSGGQALKQVN